MSFQAIGDLAQFMTTRRHSAGLQTRLAQLTQEMSSGETADVSRHLNAGFRQLSDVEHRIALNAAYKSAGAEAATHAAAMQGALELVQTQLADISAGAVLTGSGAGGPALAATAATARAGLDTIVSALNTGVAGRPVFAGTELDNLPLVDGATLMSEVLSAVSGAGDSASVLAALDTFFDVPGGGFETAIYKGGFQDIAAIRLGAGESVRLSIRADDAALRSVLKNTVAAALAGEGSLSLSQSERAALLKQSGESILSDIDGLIGVRSDLGLAEARIDRSIARIGAERNSLSIMRNEIMSVDRFETASALQQAQLQLETIYTLTARTARLKLVNFL